MRKMLVLVLSLVGMQAVAIPVARAETPDFVTGTYTVTSDLSSLEMTTRGHQCILHIENTITFSGDLVGVAETAGPAEVRFPVPCDELVAGVPSIFHDVADLVLGDGSEATLYSFGRTDANGNFSGVTVLRGDLRGVLHTAGVAGQNGSYQGVVVSP